MKRVVGIVLLLLGSSLFLFSFFNRQALTRTDTVIDISFVLEPGEEYGPWDNGTSWHTQLSKTALTGELEIEGGAINLTADGYNTQHLKNVLITQDYSFVIDPALSSEIYTFTFDNGRGNTQGLIKFTLKETYTDTSLLVLTFSVFLISAMIGTALIILDFLEKKKS